MTSSKSEAPDQQEEVVLVAPEVVMLLSDNEGSGGEEEPEVVATNTTAIGESPNRPPRSTTTGPPTTTSTATASRRSTTTTTSAGGSTSSAFPVVVNPMRQGPTKADVRVLSPQHRDACLRILHLLASSSDNNNNTTTTAVTKIWEQFIVPQLQHIYAFMLQRYPIQQQHYAISKSIWMESFLFLKLYASYEWYNRLLLGRSVLSGGGGTQQQHPNTSTSIINNNTIHPLPPTMVYRDSVRLYEQLLLGSSTSSSASSSLSSSSSLHPSSLLTAARFLREEPHCLSILARGDEAFQKFCITSLDKMRGKTLFLLECLQDWNRVLEINNAKFIVPLPTVEYPNQDEPLVEAYANNQIQLLGWKLSCLRAPHPNSRRTRLLSSCASIVVLSALYYATVRQVRDDDPYHNPPPPPVSQPRPEEKSSASDDKPRTASSAGASSAGAAASSSSATGAAASTAPPPSKKLKLFHQLSSIPAVHRLVNALRNPPRPPPAATAQTPFAGMTPHPNNTFTNVDPPLTIDEIGKEVFVTAHLLWKHTASTIIKSLKSSSSWSTSIPPPPLKETPILPPPPRPWLPKMTTNSTQQGRPFAFSIPNVTTATAWTTATATSTTSGRDTGSSYYAAAANNTATTNSSTVGRNESSSSNNGYDAIVPPWMRDMERTPFDEEITATTATLTKTHSNEVVYHPWTVTVSAHQVVEHLHETIETLYHDIIIKPQYQNDDGLIYDEATLVQLDPTSSLHALQELPTETLLQEMIRDQDKEERERTNQHQEQQGGKNPASRVTAPPTFSDVMDVNEWTVALLYLDIVQPSSHLHHMIEAHGAPPRHRNSTTAATTSESNDEKPPSMWKHITPILNRIVLRLSQQFIMTSKPTRFAPVVIEEYGKVTVLGELTPDKKLLKAVVAMFYHGLEAILFREMLRLQSMPEYRDRAMDMVKTQMVCHPPFHAALMACSITCVTKAVGVTQKIALHAISALQVCGCPAHDFVLVSELFQRTLTENTPARGHMGSPLMFALPRLLGKEVENVERQVMNSWLWMDPPQKTSTQPKPFVEVIEDFREMNIWPPECLVGISSSLDAYSSNSPPDVPEHSVHYDNFRNISSIFRRVLKLSYDRMVDLLEFLGVQRHLVVARYSLEALRYLMRKHVNMLTNRHLDHMILCCLYGVSKILQCHPEVTFVKLIDAYVVVRGPAEGDVTCQRVVRNVIVSTAYDDEGDDADSDGAEHDTDMPPIGNIIQLYNQVFVPKLKDFLVHNPILTSGALEMGRDNENNAFDSAMDPLDRWYQQRFGSTTIRVTIQENPGRTVQERLRAGGSASIMEFGRPSERNLKQANDAAS